MPLSAMALRADGAARGAPPLVDLRRRRLAAGAAGARRRRFVGGAAAAPGADLIDLGDDVADRDGLARLAQDLAQDAGARRRHLQRRLLAFDLDQRLVGRDLVALGALPRADRGLADRFTQCRNAQRQRHQTLLPNASAISRACSRKCRFIEPVAGLADSGRLTHDHWNEPASSPCSSRFMYAQAPMFFGSSCTHTTGVPSGNVDSISRRSSLRSG